MTHLRDRLAVKLKFAEGEEPRPVGTLALARQKRGYKIYFQYDEEFLANPLPLSPLHLPPERRLFHFDDPAFECLPGLFNDSLPDGWGRLLFDRFAAGRGFDRHNITPLDRLAHKSGSAMGALIYEPVYAEEAANPPQALNLDFLSREAERVMRGAAAEVVGELLALNGSSAGARPKALVQMDKAGQNIIYAGEAVAGYEPWLVKFANSRDGADAGAIEYVYALMAKKAGLTMPPVRLLPAAAGPGFFAVRRFDRLGPGGRDYAHMHSAAGLLQSDFRAPALDYKDLMALTQFLTKDFRETEKMFRLAAFNVLAHNRDDHGKNFSFLMDRAGEWKISPAYDLTFSRGPNGEQSTMLLGEGRAPDKARLLKLGKAFKLEDAAVAAIIEQVRAAVSCWPQLAAEHGVSRASIAEINRFLPI